MLEDAQRIAEPAGDISAPAAPAIKTTGIAILGSHPATVAQAPFGNESWRIWACSPHNFEMRRLQRLDAWFEVHIPLQDKTRAYNYLKYLETLPLVWMRDQGQMQHFPGARLYPEKEMKERFGPFTFTSSIAYMLAKAIVDCEQQGVKQIGLYGIMQASQTEYAYQRPGIQNLIWEATRSGIKVIAPRESCLFDPPKDEW